MHLITDTLRDTYIKKYRIQPMFSFPITELIQVHSFDRGEFIIKEGTYPKFLYYLVEGKCKIYYTHPNGKVSLLDFVEPGTFIGEIELLHEAYYSKGIQTATKSVCLAIPVHACKEELLKDATFLKYLCTFLSDKASLMGSKYMKSLAYPLENRLAEFILLSADNNVYKEKHTEVCEYLGVSYRHLLHVLAQFAEDGYIKKEGRSYKLVATETLEEMAKSVRR